jgi:hypothetical protein
LGREAARIGGLMDKSEDMRLRFLEISRKTGVPVKKVADLFYYLKSGEALDNGELLRKLGVSRNAINRVKQMAGGMLLPVSQKTSLDPDWMGLVRGIFTDDYKPEEEIFGFLEGEVFLKVKEFFEDKVNRLSPERRFDQFTATPETVARRASLMIFFGDIGGKRLAFLGDDDFTSVAATLADKPAAATVFEIDERIVKGIGQVSDREGLGIETVEYDARKRIPEDYAGKYDVVFTDPPYTADGVSLFLSRCVDLLDPRNFAARIYVCYGNSDRAKERFLPVQKAIADAGLMIRWMFDKFNRYSGAESVGNASCLYVTDVSGQTLATIRGEFNEKIYTI